MRATQLADTNAEQGGDSAIVSFLSFAVVGVLWALQLPNGLTKCMCVCVCEVVKVNVEVGRSPVQDVH